MATAALLLSGTTATGAFATTEDQGTQPLVWFAQDAEGAAVSGATFEVADEEGTVTTVTDNLVPDENVTAGALTIDVPLGSYEITQVSTADGLEVAEESRTVRLTERGQTPRGAVVFIGELVEDEVAGDDGAAGEDEAATAEQEASEEGDVSGS